MAQVALLRVSFEMLHRALGLPDDVEIVASNAPHDELGTVDLRLEGPTLGHVSPGKRIPYVMGICRTGEAKTELVPHYPV